MERSCWTYPDSEEFKRSKEAQSLCHKLTEEVRTSILSADIEAMVADARKPEKKVYYSKGKIRSDQEIMTDEIAAEFDQLKTMRKTLLEEYKIVSKISDIKQGKMLDSINYQFKHLENKKENKHAESLMIVLDDIRDQCEEQLWETIQDIAISHEDDNMIIVEDMRIRLDTELLPLQGIYRDLQASYDQITMEYEKVKLDALQSYLILKKNNLLPDNIYFTFTNEDEAKLMDMLKGYQTEINKKDEAIANLKKQIKRLEFSGAESSSRRLTIRGSVAGKRQSVLNRPSVADSSFADTVDESPVQPEVQEIDYSKADELEKNYLVKLERIKADNLKELQIWKDKEEKIRRDWEIKTRSIANLQINAKLQKILKKQNLLIDLATKARPRPDCDKEVTANISGITLRQMGILQLKNMLNYVPIETQASVLETIQYTLSCTEPVDDYSPPRADLHTANLRPATFKANSRKDKSPLSNKNMSE
jgi:hypothetical protein